MEPALERRTASRCGGSRPATCRCSRSSRAGTPSIVRAGEPHPRGPGQPELHLQLADRLLDGGEETRGLEELELALDGFERLGDWGRATQVAERLVALAPDTIRHHQKRVELAFRPGERTPLLGAYLALGDALARMGATDKAMAVYGRVREHDPENAHALAAIARLQREPRPGAAAPAPPAARRRAQRRTQPSGRGSRTGSLRRRPRAAASADAFVDLGSMILDESGPRGTPACASTGRDPKGQDEQKEFQEILEQFKRGHRAEPRLEDYQAHYDLGIAFKEMGLLDEAIAEFQKALRSPEGRLRTSEALGICFFDKGQFAIAETVLRRAVRRRGRRGRRQDRPALLAGPRGGGPGEGAGGASPATSGPSPSISGSWT